MRKQEESKREVNVRKGQKKGVLSFVSSLVFFVLLYAPMYIHIYIAIKKGRNEEEKGRMRIKTMEQTSPGKKNT